MEDRKRLIDTTKEKPDKSRTWDTPRNSLSDLHGLRMGLKQEKREKGESTGLELET